MLIVSNKQFRAEAAIFTLVYIKILFFILYISKNYSYILRINVNIFFYSFDVVVKFNVSIEFNMIKVVRNYTIDVQ